MEKGDEIWFEEDDNEEKELLSEKALEDDLELDEDLERLPI